jgi:sugar lactone lactonase YvrE
VKSLKISLARMAALALFSLGFASSSFAGTYALNYPYGLAVDAKGNLYVANSNNNQILVYNSSHAQVPNKTITQGISAPSGLAFDPNGNLWVANQTSNSVTAYTSTGKQIPSATITTGISSPQALSVDGLGDVWVENGFSYLTIYAQNQTSALLTLPADFAITSVATHEGYGAVGTNNFVAVFPLANEIQNNGSGSSNLYSPTCFAAAYDKSGNLYCGNEDESVSFVNPAGGIGVVVTSLGFFPTGLALDNARGLIYIADGPGNKIVVYNTAGKYLTTIQ